MEILTRKKTIIRNGIPVKMVRDYLPGFFAGEVHWISQNALDYAKRSAEQARWKRKLAREKRKKDLLTEARP